jgi:pimeloyl-ACP methyl ester carboxylesterase
MKQRRTHVTQHQTFGYGISYDDLGQGDTALLLLPGWCASRQVFHDLPAKLAENHRVLVLDWRGHGRSVERGGDFGTEQLVADAITVIEASGVRQIIPVALAHAGWVAIELKRRLAARVPRLVLMEWLLCDAPTPFRDTLRGLQTPARWQVTRDALLTHWIDGADNAALRRFLSEDMALHGFAMWSRAAREIGAAYRQWGSPLAALAALSPALPTLHLYATPDDRAYLALQQAFAASHPWFTVRKLAARTHFPMFEDSTAMAVAIDRFVKLQTQDGLVKEIWHARLLRI